MEHPLPTETLAWLTQVAGQMSRAETLETLSGITQQVLERFSVFECNGLYLKDPANGALRLYWCRGFTPEERAEAERTAQERHPGWVFRTRQILRVDDTFEAGLDTPSRDSRRSFVTRSRLWLPVLSQDECVGAFGLASTRPRAFTDWDLHVLQFVCNLTGIAYERIVQEDLRRATEQKLRTSEAEAAAAIKAAQLKDAFLATISHELRTPLNGVIGFAHLLLQSRLEGRPREYAQKVLNSGNALLALINDILDLSKIEAGRVELEHVTFKPEDAVRATCDVLVGRAAEKRVELVVDLQRGLPVEAVGDPLRLQQLLTNIVGNAVKFTDQGEIRLSVSAEPAVGGVQRWRFTCQDTGIGMSPEQQRRVFQPFTQADQSTTRRYGGTGLGLSISQRLAHLMGGAIHVSSVPGQGSTFTAELQLGTAATSEESAPRPPVKRALVVDDHPLVCEVIARYLSLMGVEADQALSAQEGLQRVAAADSAGAPYQLVLLDWQLPGMDGITAAAQLTRKTTLRLRPAVVLVTADARETVREAALEAGASAVLGKPVVPALLRGLFEQIWPTALHASSTLPPARSGPRLDGLKVLLVEDHSINQLLATELLTRAGARVTLAENGQQALDHLVGSPVGRFDIVLMDVEMPVMDGLEATRRIRRDPRFQSLPVIAMTAHAMADQKRACLASGMNDHLPKPFEPADLLNMLARWRPGSSVPAGNAAAVTPVAPTEPVEQPPAPTAPRVPPAPEILAAPGATAAAAEKLVKNLGKDVARKLLERFVSDQPGALAGIDRAMLSGDARAVRNGAHALRGVAGMLGFTEIARHASLLEAASKDPSPQPEGWPSHRGGLSSALETTCRELNAWLRQSAG